MKCPHCRSEETEVFNTRTTKSGNQIWRRRRCAGCQQSFTTYEAPDLSFIRIEKPNHRPQGYSRAKLFSSIYAAFTDTEAKPTTIDAVTDTVESKLLDLQKESLTTGEIADVVLQTLKHFQTSAFVRYLASQTHLASEAQLRKELKKY